MITGIDKSFVKKTFNRHASTYDNNAGIQARLGNQLLYLLNGTDSGVSTILDIGMGTGSMTARLLKKFPDARIHGCDIAESMIACAREKKNLQSQKDLFITADTEFLPYVSNCFDLVISSFTLQWLVEWGRAVGEVLRVLRPGGVFLWAAFGKKTFEELKLSYQRACRETHYRQGKALLINFTEEKFITIVQSSGFVKPFARTQIITEKYPDVAELVRSIKAMGAQNAARQRNKGLGIRKAWHRMIALYERDFGQNQGIPATFEIIMGGGQKP